MTDSGEHVVYVEVCVSGECLEQMDMGAKSGGGGGGGKAQGETEGEEGMTVVEAVGDE